MDNEGRVFYVDHNTRTTTWEKPEYYPRSQQRYVPQQEQYDQQQFSQPRAGSTRGFTPQTQNLSDPNQGLHRARANSQDSQGLALEHMDSNDDSFDSRLQHHGIAGVPRHAGDTPPLTQQQLQQHQQHQHHPPMSRYGTQVFQRRPSDATSTASTQQSATGGGVSPPQRQTSGRGPSRSTSFFGSLQRSFSVRRPSFATEDGNGEDAGDDASVQSSFRTSSGGATAGGQGHFQSSCFFAENEELQHLANEIVPPDAGAAEALAASNPSK